MIRIFCWLLGCTTAIAVLAEEPAEDLGRAARLQFVKDRLAQFSLAKAGETVPVKSVAEPVLRYSNPVRNSLSDGSTFIWVDGSRPVAACAYSIRGPESPPKVYRELASLSAEPLQLSRDDSIVWQPRQGGLCNQPVPGASPPSDKAGQRLTEMRAIARRFEAEFFREVEVGPTQLRLLPQPIHRFQAPDQGTIDGGLFALVEANDPELLLMVEARASPKSGGRNEPAVEWKFSLARMTSARLSVRMDGKEIFAPGLYWRNPRTPEDPYMEAHDGIYREEASEPVIGKGAR